MNTKLSRSSTRRAFMRTLALGAATLALPRRLHATNTVTTAAASKPNVLFIFSDDMRADCIAAMGNPVIKTPNLDRLYAQGVAFNRAYMQGAFGGATCVPSRAMLLTGQSLFHVDNDLMRDETWPAAFGRAGYSTFMSGKWHNGTASVARSFKSARSVFLGGMTNPLKAPLRNLENGEFTKPIVSPQHSCATFADEVIKFLGEQKTGPFFCYLPFNAPHDPHIVPADFPVKYDLATIPLPPNFMPQHPFNNGTGGERDEKLLPHPRTPEAVKGMIADYYRYVSYLDMQVGRVLDALAASPHAKNTIVAFAGDSGVARGAHGLIGKQNLYEHSIHVPLVVSGPGIAKGSKTDAMCYLFDILPTIGSMCGVPAPPKSEGRDLTAVLRDPSQPGRDSLVFAYCDLARAVRNDRMKLIRYPKIDKTQLFDLKADPYELKDLSTDPAQAKTVADLTALLTTTLKEYGDKCPWTSEKLEDSTSKKASKKT